MEEINFVFLSSSMMSSQSLSSFAYIINVDVEGPASSLFHEIEELDEVEIEANGEAILASLLILLGRCMVPNTAPATYC
jgi:hypothetical protein